MGQVDYRILDAAKPGGFVLLVQVFQRLSVAMRCSGAWGLSTVQAAPRPDTRACLTRSSRKMRSHGISAVHTSSYDILLSPIMLYFCSNSLIWSSHSSYKGS